VFRPIDGGADVLREFVASIGYSTESGPEDIGSVREWIGWRIDDGDLRDAADAVTSDAEQLGATAAAIIDAHPESFIDTVLLIDRMHLAPQWRGNRLSGIHHRRHMSLLSLDAKSTVVVLQPEPQAPGGGPMDDGPGRDQALARLKSAYRASGLEPWRGSAVWWRPL